MSFLLQLQALEGKVRNMLQLKDAYLKNKTPDNLKKWLAAEGKVRKMVYPQQDKEKSQFNWLAQ